MVSRRAAGACVLLLVVLSVVTPHALGGSAADPEIEDGCESDDDRTLPAALDVDRAWVEPFLEQEVIVQVCGDLSQEEAAAGRYGWQFRFNDTEGSKYNVRAWATFGNWFQCVTRDGEMIGKKERQGGETEYPRVDFESDRLILHFPPAGSFVKMLVREDLHAVGVFHDQMIPFAVDCGHRYQVLDRAPDEGFGADVNLTRSDREAETTPRAVDLVAERSDLRLLPGASAEISFAAEKSMPVHREMNLTLDAPEGWPANLDVSWIEARSGQVKTVDFGTEVPLVLPPFADRNRTVLTISVPESAPPGTYPITLGGPVRNETGHLVGEVSASAEVRVPSFAMRLDGQETRFLVKPDGSIVNGIEITNEGGVPDTYDLSISGEPAGWARLEREVVELDPGRTATVDLTVDVPPNASEDVYRHTVEAVSRTVPGLGDRTTTTTQVLDAVIADPLGAATSGRPTPTVVGLYGLAIGGLAAIGVAAGKP